MEGARRAGPFSPGKTVYVGAQGTGFSSRQSGVQIPLFLMGTGALGTFLSPTRLCSFLSAEHGHHKALLGFLAQWPPGLAGKELSPAPGTFSGHGSRVGQAPSLGSEMVLSYLIIAFLSARGRVPDGSAGPPCSSNLRAQLPYLVLHLLQLGWYVLHRERWGPRSSRAPGVGLGSLGGRGTQ